MKKNKKITKKKHQKKKKNPKKNKKKKKKNKKKNSQIPWSDFSKVYMFVCQLQDGNPRNQG